jgi:hypothetical protein
MSDKPPVHEALASVMADVKAVRKEERNQAQGFNFRGIDAVLNAVGPALRAHGVIVLPTVLKHTYGTVTSTKGTVMGHVIVKVRYEFIGPAGDSITCTTVGESMDTGDKATSKAMSVALRTALLQSLALPTDEPDPDLDVYERQTPTVVSKPGRKKTYADSAKVPELVESFTGVETERDLADVAQQIPHLDLSDAEKELLRNSYMAAKQRLEASVGV